MGTVGVVFIKAGVLIFIDRDFAYEAQKVARLECLGQGLPPLRQASNTRAGSRLRRRAFGDLPDMVGCEYHFMQFQTVITQIRFLLRTSLFKQLSILGKTNCSIFGMVWIGSWQHAKYNAMVGERLTPRADHNRPTFLLPPLSAMVNFDISDPGYKQPMSSCRQTFMP